MLDLPVRVQDYPQHYAKYNDDIIFKLSSLANRSQYTVGFHDRPEYKQKPDRFANVKTKTSLETRKSSRTDRNPR